MAEMPEEIKKEMQMIKTQIDELRIRFDHLEQAVRERVAHETDTDINRIKDVVAADMQEAKKPANELYEPPDSPLSSPDVPPAPKTSREAEIGMKWFGLAGIILVVVAFSFFVKYAIDNQWIGPTTRIVGGIALALIFILTGNILKTKKQYKGYDRTLIGGGFALLYFTLYAAHHFYAEFTHISLVMDIILLTIVVASAIIYSIKLDSALLAGEAFLLGYATAYLCGAINVFTLLYNVVLAVGLIYLARRKGWFRIGVAGLAATYIIHINWLNNNPSALLMNLLFLFCYFGLFMGLVFAQKQFGARVIAMNVEKKLLPLESRCVIYAIAILNLFIPFFTMESGSLSLIYYLAIDLTLVFLILRYSIAGLGIGAVVANYIAFLLWNNSVEGQTAMALLFLACLLTIFTVCAFLMQLSKTGLIFEEVVIVVMNKLCFFGFLFHKIISEYHEYAGLFTLSMAVLCVCLCRVAMSKKLTPLSQTYLALATVFVTLAIPVQLTKNWLPLSWAVESAMLFYLSVILDNKLLRWLSRFVAVAALCSVFIFIGEQGLRAVMLVVSAASFFILAVLSDRLMKIQRYDMKFLETYVYAIAGAGLAIMQLNLVFAKLENSVFAVCLLGIALLAVARYRRLYWLYAAAFTIHLILSMRTLYSVAENSNIAMQTLLPQLLIYYIVAYRLYKGEYSSPFEQIKQAGVVYASCSTIFLTYMLACVFSGHWITIAWAVEAVCVLIIGFVSKSRYIRYVGIGLLVLSLAKALIRDMASLDLAYRVVSLFGVGVILLVASFLYYRYRKQIEELL